MSTEDGGRRTALSAVEEIRLISDAKQGDTQSFEALVERYMGPAIHVAAGYVRNREDAVDLAQEAFFRVYKSLDRFRDGEPFAPWFFRILRNACLNHLEKRRLRRHASLHAEDGSAIDTADAAALCPGRQAELSESQRQFWAALDELSDPHREIILLRHVEELEYAQIAAILDIPVGTVMSRLFHARRRLRGILEPLLEGRR